MRAPSAQNPLGAPAASQLAWRREKREAWMDASGISTSFGWQPERCFVFWPMFCVFFVLHCLSLSPCVFNSMQFKLESFVFNKIESKSGNSLLLRLTLRLRRWGSLIQCLGEIICHRYWRCAIVLFVYYYYYNYYYFFNFNLSHLALARRTRGLEEASEPELARASWGDRDNYCWIEILIKSFH